MSYDYIERFYGKRFEPGMRVWFTEYKAHGTVQQVRGNPHYVMVQFDDGREGNCHPNSLEDITMSPELKAFYRNLLNAVDTNFVDSTFKINHGLCYNLAVWCVRMEYARDLYRKLVAELDEQFEVAGLPSTFPFNMQEGIPNYFAEPNKYANSARLAWVKANAK